MIRKTLLVTYEVKVEAGDEDLLEAAMVHVSEEVRRSTTGAGFSVRLNGKPVHVTEKPGTGP